MCSTWCAADAIATWETGENISMDGGEGWLQRAGVAFCPERRNRGLAHAGPSLSSVHPDFYSRYVLLAQIQKAGSAGLQPPRQRSIPDMRCHPALLWGPRADGGPSSPCRAALSMRSFFSVGKQGGCFVAHMQVLTQPQAADKSAELATPNPKGTATGKGSTYHLETRC